ncbi:MAG: hypothetical protein IT584_00880 [Chlamydiae bacterium]|nr:hypothetical protein [Chlamydiota bacterium]
MVQKLFSFVTLGCLLLTLLSLPKSACDPIRSSAVASFGPVWHLANNFKTYLKERPLFSAAPPPTQEIAQLQLEVRQLRSQLNLQTSWQDWLKYQESGLCLLQKLKQEGNEPFFQRRYEEMSELMEKQFFAVPAPVIYRDPSSWSSSLWIQVGQKDNESLGRAVIAKNSPVVVGSSLVGVVEFVGKNQSRVRLITDSGLTISVRAARGKVQDQAISQWISVAQSRLSERKDLFANPEQQKFLLETLKDIQHRLSAENGYYAKGQLQGSFAPFWRSRGLLLQGIGFNYDYADEEGPARELRTGKPVGTSGPEIDILREGDVLVTSGLDGVFPAGIEVAILTKIAPLSEGAYGYEIQARPTASRLNDLETVFVLPPLSIE